MKLRELLNESLNVDQGVKIIGTFVAFALDHLSIAQGPRITLLTDSGHSSSNCTFGQYGNGHITITIKGRHVMDVCRTLAHELVHYRQDQRGELDNKSGQTGSPLENEANAVAAVIMRRWGKLNPRLFSHGAIS